MTMCFLDHLPAGRYPQQRGEEEGKRYQKGEGRRKKVRRVSPEMGSETETASE